jgi:DNA repair protein RecN (Recombination protein N)
VLRSLRVENLVLIRSAELDLAPGLNAITGETGAGKTILAQAVGLLLGAKGDAVLVGPAASEAYVEAELEVANGIFDEDALTSLADLRPGDDPGLVVARRVFADGRTRAYAWGRAAAREDVAAAAERVIAMSGQFEQRRLARASYQLEVLDRFAGQEQLARRAELRQAWRALLEAKRNHEHLTQDSASAAAWQAELRALVEDTHGLKESTEDDLRAERERIRHIAELASGAAAAADALAPDDSDGASGLVASAERAVAPLERLAPELARAGDELRDIELRLRETASELRGFLTSLEAEPDRLEHVEAELDRIAETKRRFRCADYAELIARACAAREELDVLDDEHDPVRAAAEAVAAAEAAVSSLCLALSAVRAESAESFAEAVAAELVDIGMGAGEFRVELVEREPGPAGSDEIAFLIRPNRGLPFAPVAETASGGELSRVALAIAAACARNGGGGETLVFDEIDAGIGGETANAVGRALRRLAERTQVITITHLPQIAALADRHFRVEKIDGDPTHTQIAVLDDDAHRAELERMLGGHEFLASVR